MTDFIFGGRTGIASPDDLARRRELVRALKVRSAGHVPRNMWEGLNSVAEAVGGRIEEGRLDKVEAARRKSADDKFTKLLKSGVQNMPASPDDDGIANFARALAGALGSRPKDLTPSVLDATADPWMSEPQRDLLKRYFSRRLPPAESNADLEQPRGGTK